MEKVIHELRELIAASVLLLKDIPESDFSSKPVSHRWSKKEIMGHLIDSAQNNLRRFIVSQYESTPPHIIYQQDFWVSANQYQKMKTSDVIELWRLTNAQIISVLSSMPPEKQEFLCQTNEPKTLHWLAVDYLRHTRHHLSQVVSIGLNR
jgi:hypothetical protein